MFSTSIFRKMLASFLGLLLIGMALAALLLNIGMQRFLIAEQERVLIAQGNELVGLLQDSFHDHAANAEFERLAAQYRRTNQTKIDLLLLDESKGARKFERSARRLLAKNDIQDPDFLDQVLAGKQARHVGSFVQSDEQVLLTVGLPIMNENRVTGAIFLHKPVQEIRSGQVTRLILLITLAISVPSCLVVYFLSRRITGPLVRMNAGVLRFGEGNFRERVKVESRDETGQLAASFNRMAEQLEQLDSLRKDLIANVSHELRTPLTSVRGFVQGLMEGMVPAEEQPRILRMIHNELQRLTALLNSMLDLSAIESGRVAFEYKTIRWSTLVDSVAETVRPRAEAQGIAFRIIEPEGERLRAYGDSDRLKQVLFNLLDNAVRHTPAGGTITVASSSAGGRLECSVTDTGAGIPPEKLSRIWERFYTDEPARNSRKDRSGLGLTIVKQLVERMGGTIRVQSTPGQGTAFTFTLPAEPPSAKQRET